jgi:lipopolysaccharide transport system permease protein
MFIRRDFVSVYKQTLLGPIWFIVQPLMTTIMFTVIFTGVAKIPTDGLPPMLFYLAGTTPWNYFSNCLTKTAGTFVNNAGIFGKVYFPRLVTPISVVVSNLIQFSVQFMLLFGFLAWYLAQGAAVHPNWLMIPLLTPVLLLLMALLGLGTGILASSFTTKYRDLTFLLSFGVQLAMYATPVIYPMSSIPDKYRAYIELNPMSAIIETFRAVYLGPSPALVAGDFRDFPALAAKLKDPSDAVSVWVRDSLPAGTRQALADYGAPGLQPVAQDGGRPVRAPGLQAAAQDGGRPVRAPGLQAVALERMFARDLNELTRTNSIYTAQRFAAVSLRPETQTLLAQAPQKDLHRLNRLLLEDAYPQELARSSSGIPWGPLGVSATITLVLLLLGIAIFNKVEKTFMDTV